MLCMGAGEMRNPVKKKNLKKIRNLTKMKKRSTVFHSNIERWADAVLRWQKFVREGISALTRAHGRPPDV